MFFCVIYSSVGRTFALASFSGGEPAGRDTLREPPRLKQACVSRGDCVLWPHPHFALGDSAWP